MWQDGVITREERAAICAISDEEEKSNKKMLEILSTKCGWAFVKFIEALDSSGQEHFSNLFQPDGEFLTCMPIWHISLRNSKEDIQ